MTGTLAVDGPGELLHLVQRGGEWQLAQALLAVPNVTAHSSTASVPTSSSSMWHYNCLRILKGSKSKRCNLSVRLTLLSNTLLQHFWHATLLRLVSIKIDPTAQNDINIVQEYRHCDKKLARNRAFPRRWRSARLGVTSVEDLNAATEPAVPPSKYCSVVS